MSTCADREWQQRPLSRYTPPFAIRGFHRSGRTYLRAVRSTAPLPAGEPEGPWTNYDGTHSLAPLAPDRDAHPPPAGTAEGGIGFRAEVLQKSTVATFGGHWPAAIIEEMDRDMTTATRKTRRRKRSAPQLREGFDATTTEDQSSLDQYLKEVSTHRLLKPIEEVELGRRAQSGDEDAVQELVRANLRFVISVAKKYQNRGVSLSDLIQEGNVGLVTAARKFDPEQGVKFISYAVWWIRQAILSALANQGRAVRVPLNRASDLSKIFRERERLKQELRRDPTPQELSAATGLSPEIVESLQTLNAAEIRLDAPIGDTDDSQLMDRFISDEAIVPEEEVEERLLTERIGRALETLQPRDAKVLRLYFGLDGGREHTLEEIGVILGVTRERIRQLRDRALRRLREGEEGTALASFTTA